MMHQYWAEKKDEVAKSNNFDIKLLKISCIFFAHLYFDSHLYKFPSKFIVTTSTGERDS